jgi:hypothetical protein
MTSLRTTLSHLATDFATQVLHAIRGASLEDILSETGGQNARSAGRRVVSAQPASQGRRGRARKGGRLGRRSADDIAGVVDKIVGLLQKHQTGLRAAQIRERLSLLPKELPRPIAEALAKKRIVKEGQKRATTYFAKDGAKRAAKPAKATKSAKAAG